MHGYWWPHWTANLAKFHAYSVSDLQVGYGVHEASVHVISVICALQVVQGDRESLCLQKPVLVEVFPCHFLGVVVRVAIHKILLNLKSINDES